MYATTRSSSSGGGGGGGGSDGNDIHLGTLAPLPNLPYRFQCILLAQRGQIPRVLCLPRKAGPPDCGVVDTQERM
ncbi:hypothetical protein PV325_002343 [Microctonus aethiopoides]|nr:hypothetical protein PV325_002343 [Microctonus aethiopoides]